MNTRVGEGFQQEVSAQYAKTNGKNAEHQVRVPSFLFLDSNCLLQISIMDEREEAMARIQMAVDAWLESQAEDEKTRTLEAPTAQSAAHWKLGAAEARLTSTRLETLKRGNLLFHDFNFKLRQYLAQHYPAYVVRPEEDIHVNVPCRLFILQVAEPAIP